MNRLNCKKIFLALMFGVVFSLKSAWAGELSVQQVFENIFMVSPQGPTGGNSVFIITEEGVLVADSGSSPSDALRIIDEIRRHTNHPIRFVINTHYLGTHTFGNSVFRREGAIIIGHKNVQRALAGERGKLELRRLQEMGVPGLNLGTIMPPNMVFEKRLEMIFGGYQIQLIPTGPALTDGDILIYLPDFKTIVAGGIVGNRVIPRLEESDWQNWTKILGTFDNYKAEIILPGSGPVGEKPSAIQMRHYLLDIKQQIELQKGKPFQKIMQTTISFLKRKYGSWARQDRTELNVHKVYADLLKLGPGK